MQGGDLHQRARLTGFILGGLILLAALGWVWVASGWLIAALLALGVAGWVAAVLFHRRLARARRRADAADRLSAAGAVARESDARRLQAAMAINHALAASAAGELDERGLMQRSLSAITGLLGALGCSYVPVDEWQQPLPAFTFGQIPEPALEAWSTHLATRLLRERCAACQGLDSNPDACPLHPAELGNALAVYCLPLTRANPLAGADQAQASDPRDGQTVGVLHLYLPAGRAPDAATRRFLNDLFEQVAQGYEAARLRDQEQATLRQLRMLRAPEEDITATLGGLLDGVIQALAADFALIRLRPATDERFSNLSVLRGAAHGVSAEALDCLASKALDEALAGRESASPPGQPPVWLALPLAPPRTGEDGDQPGPLGVILAGIDHPGSFHPRQRAILQTVAAQSALLIEKERLLRSLEYRVVIQERVRLAREIHDGLAQTLAALKLQAAQMQAYLAQGDSARLGELLKENYQALSEAYLDTREAIDALRLTPQEGLEDWLMHSLSGFEAASGLRVARDIQPLAHPLAPEVQAQLMRIVQEALNNIRKHARAHAARLSLREWQGALVLEIADDGKGFDSDDVPEVTRHGLRGMRERAEWIGADFQITSQPGKGATLRLSLPLPRETEAAR